MNSEGVILNSGGMDTFLLAHRLALAGIYPQHVFVNVGQTYFTKEREAAEAICASVGQPLHHVVRGSDFAQFEHPSGIIPFRNALLLLCAAQYGDVIYMGVLKDEVNSDKSPEFLSAMVQVLNISHRKQYWTQGREFSIETPLRPYSKSELVGQYLTGGGFTEPLLRTVSCYDAQTGHCGRCASCFKRWVALVNNGIDLGAHGDYFNRDPLVYKTAAEWRRVLPSYTEDRQKEVTSALAIAGVYL